MDTSLHTEDIQNELEQLRIENRKLSRELKFANNLLEKYKRGAIAKDNLSAVLAAEKTQQEIYIDIILKNSKDIIMLFDTLGRFVLCTDSFLDEINLPNFGFIKGNAFDAVFQRFIGGENADKISRMVADALKAQDASKFDEQLNFNNALKAREYTILAAPVKTDKGDRNGTLLIFHDMTDLVRAKENAEAASIAKSDFLATMSHEIRTPMNAIIGITDIMARTITDELQKDYLYNIKKSSNTLLALINDILDFSKIEAGKLELVKDYYDLHMLLNNLTDIFKLMFEQKQISFISQFSPDLPKIVYGDENRLSQILTNILNNALKYTTEGHVEFKAAMNGGVLQFEVTDSGIGIKPENIERLFKPFEQLDLRKNKKIVGTGLGLAITNRLCELMNGNITVKSVYGCGSTFIVTLPAAIGTENDLRKETVETYSFSASSARVLIVDDIHINLVVAEAMLEVYGIQPDLADSGDAAIEKAKENNYDIIFMDHMMPGMDGLEATKIIRSLNENCAKVPIIALTANAIMGAKEMFLSNGMNDFVSKPISATELSACLIRWLPNYKIKFLDIM